MPLVPQPPKSVSFSGCDGSFYPVASNRKLGDKGQVSTWPAGLWDQQCSVLSAAVCVCVLSEGL